MIKTQFFHMVMYVFDNSNLSQEIFATDTKTAVIFSLGHGRKQMLTILPTIWRPGLTHLMGGVLSQPKMFVHSHFDQLKCSGMHAFFLNQVFSCALKDNHALADKGNMYKNIHEYLFMCSRPVR